MNDHTDDSDLMMRASIDVAIGRNVNYATQQNDIPLIQALRVSNTGGEALSDVCVRVTTDPGFASPWETRVASIAPGQTYTFGTIDVPLLHDFLSKLTERVTGAVKIEVLSAGLVIGSRTEPVAVLAYDEWSGLNGLPEILAAFVLPNHPAVESVLSDASALLGGWTNNTALSGYQTKDRQRVALTAAAIYSALQRRGIHYINPPASFEDSGQKIRLPDRVFENKLATCLDLAVLCAACLEQAGLHPLIIITEGHAFTGVWLDEDTFADCATDDYLRLRKRVELGEIRVFETTGVTSEPSVSFDQAVRMGQQHLETPDAFRCVIDVQRARKSRIRPLPMRVGRGEAGLQAPEAPTPSGARPVLDDIQQPELDSIPAPIAETPATRLDRWKRKLLDLTMNNRLLNFRETKKTLPILCSDLAALEDALADGEEFRVYHRPPGLEDTSRDPGVHRKRTGENAFDELLREELLARRLHADLPEGELSRRLLDVYREARTSLEENGANTLYLALGFLAYYETAQSTQKRVAPIILIPLEIERRSVQDGFTIRQGDDDPIVNVTLIELLSHDFELTVPGMDPIPQDEHGINVAKILTAFRRAVKNLDRWEVIEDAFIGHFSFNKYLMWRDLQVRTDELQKNKVVSHLINNPNKVYEFDGAFPEPDRLDDTHRASDTFCLVNADSSQLAAVYAAADNKSFVLHGPPGTGKSQTITNIIAHALANGKSVLFVSEKMAALGVVHRRLTQAGLGPFCLELHSNKSHKKQVLDQLAQALDVANGSGGNDWIAEATRLEQLRNDLNDYVRALHKLRDTGESLFQGLSRLTGLRDTRPVDLGWQASQNVDRARRDQLRDVVSRTALSARECDHPSVSVWAAAGCEIWSPGWRNEVDGVIRNLRRCVIELEAAAGAAGPIMGFDSQGWSERDLGLMMYASKALLESPTTPATMMTASDWQQLDTSITEWVAHGQKRDELRSVVMETYTEQILALDIDGLASQLDTSSKAWFMPRALGLRRVKGTLTRVLRDGKQLDPDKLGADLSVAKALQTEGSYLSQAGDRARDLLGRFWRDGEADWGAVSKMRDATTSLRKLAGQIAGPDMEKAAALRQRWSLLLSEGHDQLASDGSIGQVLTDFAEKVNDFGVARKGLESLLALDTKMAWGEPVQAGYFTSVRGRLDAWCDHLDDLRSWCFWRTVRREAIALDLQLFVDAYERAELSAEEIGKTFDRSFYQWWVDKIVDEEPALRSFFSRDFERKIEQFRELDARYIELARAEIQARVAAQIPRGTQAVNQNSEMGILRRQMQLQRRHMPIRQLLQKTPNLLPRLKPCLLMSPLSVAQYLDPSHPPFDLVVFDEASQIPVWDAVGAIARGREAVIVGDPKQLPPTNFFDRADGDGGDSGDDIVEDLESILDDCIAAQLPSLHLRWHYRSRHESLIAFSNYQYYDNSLLTFPSPIQRMGVSFHRVEGRYDKSKSRTNLEEAKVVVAEILRRLHDPELSERSIGVVTFSMAQQGLVEDLLDEARRANPDIESFFSKDSAPNNEPVFVKNLESVQGDERDAILFSICYGPDAQGRVSMNFGPLNRDGGERRLNVAITRARQEVLVFSTLLPEHIDLSRTRARGVTDLKCFLDYAIRGPVALAEQRSTNPDAECESPFEQQVCEALRNRGHVVHPQVGCSGYRIDLGIVDLEEPGRYLLGIECDGANYHRAKTARDRDCLREMVLRDLGWRLHRVWSTDWWEKPDQELDRIEAAIEAARRYVTTPPSAEPARIASAPTIVTGPANPDQQPIEDLIPQNPELSKYEPYTLPRVLGDLQDFYDTSSDRTIRQIVEWVVQKEGPVSLNVVQQRVAEHWGIGRLGQKVQERISLLAARASVGRSTCDGRIFLWPNGVKPASYRGFRIPGSSDSSRRSAEDIAPEEAANGAIYVLEAQISLPVDDLVSETARLFGFHRTGLSVAKYMQAGIKVLVKRGDAGQQDGIVVHIRS